MQESKRTPTAPAAETEFLRHRRALFGVGGRGQWMVVRQIPPPEVFADLQPVPHAQMPAQGLAFKTAFEADNMIALHRSPDRDRRHSDCFRLDGFSQLADGLLH